MNSYTLGSCVVMTKALVEWCREDPFWIGTSAKVVYVANDYIILRSDHDGRPFSMLFPGGVPSDINRFIGDVLTQPSS